MGRMTSHILWKTKNVPNHQPDNIGKHDCVSITILYKYRLTYTDLHKKKVSYCPKPNPFTDPWCWYMAANMIWRFLLMGSMEHHVFRTMDHSIPSRWWCHFWYHDMSRHRWKTSNHWTNLPKVPCKKPRKNDVFCWWTVRYERFEKFPCRYPKTSPLLPASSKFHRWNPRSLPWCSHDMTRPCTAGPSCPSGSPHHRRIGRWVLGELGMTRRRREIRWNSHGDFWKGVWMVPNCWFHGIVSGFRKNHRDFVKKSWLFIESNQKINPNNTPKQVSIQSESFLPHSIPLENKTQTLVEPNFWRTIGKSHQIWNCHGNPTHFLNNAIPTRDPKTSDAWQRRRCSLSWWQPGGNEMDGALSWILWKNHGEMG